MDDAQTVSAKSSVPTLGEVQPILQASSIIEEGMSKDGLVIDDGSIGNIELKTEEDDSKINVESDGTSSSSTSSSSSSSEEEISWSSSSNNDDCSDDEEEEKETSGNAEEGHRDIGELEDGETTKIRGVDDEDDNDEDEDGSADDMVSWDGDGDGAGEDPHEEDEEAGIEAGPISSKNELKVLPPVPQVLATLQPHHQMLPVGAVLSIMGNQVIVEGVEKHDPLNEGSILWITEARSPLGLVDEIFGPVKNPYYSVRYNSESEVPTGISGGSHISVVLEFADYVLNNKDLYKKGYDASGLNDEEVTYEDEFSDDEKELEFKRMQKFAKRAMNDNNQPKNRNRNNGRKKKNRAKARNFGQRTVETAMAPDESRKYVHSPTPQQATVPEGNKFSQSTPQQAKMDMVQSTSTQNQHTGGPPLAPFGYHSGRPNPSVAQQCFMNGTGVMPFFPPMYNPCFTTTMNGIRPKELPFQYQQQQNPFFPNGLPMNGMPWLIPNPAQQMPQMSMMNTFVGAAYPPVFVGNNPWTNIGARGIHSGGQQFGQNQNLQQHTTQQQFNPINSHPRVTFPGNVAPQAFNQGSSTQAFNQGSSPNQGRESYGRGRGGGGDNFSRGG